MKMIFCVRDCSEKPAAQRGLGAKSPTRKSRANEWFRL